MPAAAQKARLKAGKVQQPTKRAPMQKPEQKMPMPSKVSKAQGQLLWQNPGAKDLANSLVAPTMEGSHSRMGSTRKAEQCALNHCSTGILDRP